MNEISLTAKIYEAYSALADQRICREGTKYYVSSSDRSKTYTVIKNDNCYSSNDNATYWQHYAGYPILAALMYDHLLNCDENLFIYFKNIPWKTLNAKYKNKYEKSIQEAFASVDDETKAKIKSSIEHTLTQFHQLPITVKGNREPLKP